MARETTHSKHPSSARRRREIHLEHDATIKARKRERVYRGEIHKAMLEATKLVELSNIPTLVGPLRATDKKTREDGGWQIVVEDGSVFSYASSRDKARKIVKEHNDGTNPIRHPATPISHDEAMLRLGWLRVAANKGESVETRFRSIPIDEKFEWVGVQP